mgnify:CR=1 FL=1
MESRTTVADAASGLASLSQSSGGRAETWRVLASMRLLAVMLAAIESLALPTDDRGALLTALLCYAAYAGVLFWGGIRGGRPLLPRASSWIDVVAILLFAWLAAAKSNLLMLLLFPVLFASVSFSFLSGLLVSLFGAIAAAQITMHAQAGGTAGAEPMLMPLLILALGPLVAALARAGVRINQRLMTADRLLGEVDPRLGVQRVAATLLQTLLQHLEADSGLLLVWLPGGDARLFRSDESGTVELSGERRALLLAAVQRLPADVAGTQRVLRLLGRLPLRLHAGIDLPTRMPTSAGRSEMEALAELLDARDLLATAICRRSPHPCRLVLNSSRRHYRANDAEMLAALMEHLAPTLENAALLESLADEAVATERARIGRDLHDTAIQPYLGLKYGIEALARKATADNPLRDDIQALQEVATAELHELRELVSGMRNGTRGADNALLPALRRQAKRFTELFGLEVDVHGEGTVGVNRRIAATIFPMVGEALTNVRRHTAATRAEIHITENAGACVIEITNPHPADAPPAPFVPRSISERAESLQGCAVVDLRTSGTTRLMIAIPRNSSA